MSLYVLIVLGLFAVLGGGAGVRVLQARIQQRVLRSAKTTSQVVSALVVEGNITASTVRRNALPDEARVDMDADVAQLRDRQEIAGLEVWSASDGHLFYADTRYPAGQGLLPEPVRQAADRGGLVTSSTVRGQLMIEVFLRYDPGGDAREGVIVEVMLPDDPISREVTQLTTALYLAAALFAALVAAAVVMALRRHRHQRHVARHDGLTGLGNRLQLAELAAAPLAAMSPQRPVALLLLDLDGFKQVNDTLGHDAGDELLVTVATRLRGVCGDAAAVIRLGGDEFVVLLVPQPAAGEDPLAVAGAAVLVTADLIRAEIRKPIMLSGLSVEVDASLGAAIGPGHGSDLSELLKRADAAMYEAKNTGQGVCVADGPREVSGAGRLTLLGELRRAIGTGALHLRYQPQCDTDGRVVAAEALLRWQHPERGLLEPLDFLPVVERTSLIRPLTEWVLGEAAAQCAVWRADGHDLRVSVNVAARSMLHDDLVEMVRSATEAARLPVGAVALEISEEALLADPAQSIRVLRALAGLGVAVSIDNVGARYEPLFRLPPGQVHTLKIDRRYVDRMTASPVDAAFVHAVIRLAGDLGLTAVGHGVESAETWRHLVELGCREVQGQILTPPLPSAEFGRWLRDWDPSAVPPTPVPPLPRHRRPDGPVNLDRVPERTAAPPPARYPA